MVPQSAQAVVTIVQELARAAVDANVPDMQLDLIYQRLKAARHGRAPAAPAIAAPARARSVPALAVPGIPAVDTPRASEMSEAEVAQRKESLLRFIVQLLEQKGGEDMLNNICSNEHVIALRKNIVSNVAKFLREMPEYFELGMMQNPSEGKNQIQMVRMIQQLPPGGNIVSTLKRKREEMPEEERKEALVQALAEALAMAGGTATVSEIGLDANVRLAMAGVPAKLQKFMAVYPEVFSMAPGTDGHMTASLQVDPAQAVVMADVRGKIAARGGGREKQQLSIQAQPTDPTSQDMTETESILLTEVENFVTLQGGSVTLKDLNQNATIAELRKNISANLKKFLARFPTHFVISEDSRNCSVKLAGF